MEIKSESPWAVRNLEQFLYYCCPQCDLKDQSHAAFLEHALISHPESQEYLQSFQLKEEKYVDGSNLVKQELVTEDGEEGFVPPSDSLYDDYDYMDIPENDLDYDAEEPIQEDGVETNDNEKPPAKKKRKQKRPKDPEASKSNNITNPNAWQGPFICRLCNEIYETRGDIKNHDKNVHRKLNADGVEKFYCSMCEEFFDDREKLRYHGIAKHDATGKMYKCPYCPSTVGKMIHLERHVKSEHKDKQMECDFCGIGHKNVKALVEHLEVTHKETNEDSKNQSYPCTYCIMTFDSPSLLKNHFQLIHKDQQLKCESCGKRFPDSKTLAQHKELEHENLKYQCHMCGKYLAHKHGLDGHIRKVHQGIKSQKKHQCNQCGSMFYSKHDLYYHSKSAHEKSFECTCVECGKSFGRPAQLKNHIRKVHEGERNHKCTHCEKAFFSKWSMNKHINGVHLNIRKFKCPYCDNAFKLEIHLQTHMKLKHKVIVTHAEVLALSKKDEAGEASEVDS